MICMLSSSSVSPSLPTAPAPGRDEDHQHSKPLQEEEEEEVDMKLALLDEPIVGVEQVLHDANGPGALKPRALPSPKPMTAIQKAIHDLSHLPHDPACPICAAGRGLNLPHQVSNEHLRIIPLLVADYCFITFAGDSSLQTVLVMRLYPYRLLFACCTPRKGPHPQVVQRIVKFIRDAGLTHFAYRCDREPAIGSLIDEACSVLGRSSFKVSTDQVDPAPKFPVAIAEDDEPDAPTDTPAAADDQGAPVVAVPEMTHPGESASNGLAERSVGVLEDQVRVLLIALQAHVKVPLSTTQPVVAWLVEHAAYLLNKYQVGRDDKTAFGRLHGKETKERLCEFGEKVLWFVPKRLRSKADQKF